MSGRSWRRWRKGSEFGEGLRVPMDRNRRSLWLERLKICRRTQSLKANYVEVAKALYDRLGVDGKLTPSHETIARDSGQSIRTVGRALKALKACGLVTWVRRLVRDGWQARQTTNSYALTLDTPPKILVIPHAGQKVRENSKNIFNRAKRLVIDGPVAGKAEIDKAMKMLDEDAKWAFLQAEFAKRGAFYS
jgi:DNA-binding transcriptional MocR family regulator